MNRFLGLIMAGAMLTLMLTQPLLARAGTIEERQKRQQDRIDEGVTSGELNKRETLRIEKEQARIQRKKRRYRRNDGKLGPKEKVDLMHDQNKASRHIYKEKHD